MVKKKATIALIGTGLMASVLAGCGPASAPKATGSSSAAPKTISVGTLYAGSGNFATSSLPEYAGLKFWVDQVNSQGGVYVKAYHKKIKLNLVSYNDQSSATTATNLYSQLINVNHVNILVADFGSVLTSVAVPLAQENKMLLFDQTGTGSSFFSAKNPYIVLTSLPTSGLWPESLAQYLVQQGKKRVAIVYDTNDFDQSQETTLVNKLRAAGITPVFNKGVDTATSNYSVIVHDIAASHPDAVIELGYPNNDIAFLQALKSSGSQFPMVFTIFPGQLPKLFEQNFGGAKGLSGLYTYPAPPLLKWQNVNYGMTLSQFESAYQKATGNSANFLSVAGYNTGLIIQKTLASAQSLSQLALRQAVSNVSGHVMTLDGPFAINNTGAQIGEALPVAKLSAAPSGKLQVNLVTPMKK